MNKIIIIAIAGWMLFGAQRAQAAAMEPGVEQTREERKEARQIKKEARKAKRAEYQHRERGASAQPDRHRIMRDNVRQRKQIDKASRKENRRKWGTNKGGDVFGIY